MGDKTENAGSAASNKTNNDKTSLAESHIPWSSKIKNNTEKSNILSFSTRDFVCKERVKTCFEKDPMVYLLVTALNRYGCNFTKDDVICGNFEPEELGFDHESKTISISRKNEFSSKRHDGECTQLRRQLIRAFDDCRTKFNPNSISHHACTEIRAAALTDCDRMAPMLSRFYGTSHQNCVKISALWGLLRRGLPKERTIKAIDKVFDRCYNDLEPLGRISRQGSSDDFMSLYDSLYYGYTDYKLPE